MRVAWTHDAHRRTFALMAKKVGQALIGTLALIALAIGADSALATSDKKPAAKVTEPIAAKPVVPMAAPQTARVDEAAAQAKPPRPIAPQTPPPARTARPGSALPAGPVAIVTIPPSTPPAPKAEAKPEPAKHASTPPVASAKRAAKADPKKPDPKKPAPKKLVQAKPTR
jgi:hypothetical protein